jgi:hypothetical protein
LIASIGPRGNVLARTVSVPSSKAVAEDRRRRDPPARRMRWPALRLPPGSRRLLLFSSSRGTGACKQHASLSVPISVPDRLSNTAKCWSEWQDLNLRPLVPTRRYQARSGRQVFSGVSHGTNLYGLPLIDDCRRYGFAVGARAQTVVLALVPSCLSCPARATGTCPERGGQRLARERPVAVAA